MSNDSFTFYQNLNTLRLARNLKFQFSCSLFGEGKHNRVPAGLGTISGLRGVFDSAKWTAHPQHYRKSGYLVLGTG